MDVNKWYGRLLEDKVHSLLMVDKKITIKELTDLIVVDAPEAISRSDLHKRVWNSVHRLKWLQKIVIEYSETGNKTKVILICLADSVR